MDIHNVFVIGKITRLYVFPYLQHFVAA